jgi:polyhydroxyalkanoate synthesis regulator phasin
LDVTKISDFVKLAVEKENREMKEQIANLTATMDELKKQLVALQDKKKLAVKY